MAKITVNTKKIKTVAERYNLTVEGQRIIPIEIRHHYTRELMETIMRYPNGRPVNNKLVEEKIIDFLNARDIKLKICQLLRATLMEVSPLVSKKRHLLFLVLR